ncbi:hypothetical protein SAMN05444374_10233 [Rhodococcoides kroppenstedtii]|uniref:Uncharacterized protein n=1 Tax=Rhodococcoides kroppenstedtii TaxID=293050 RepID=A0A1I0SP04_9NOCA|nr:hypothetical protein SAMN05444374_10233 [Rhodococcus kroppenstedtii]
MTRQREDCQKLAERLGWTVGKFAARRGAVMLGTLLPAGIGAAVGGAGNRALGKTVIGNARDAFGPPPQDWPAGNRPVATGPR